MQRYKKKAAISFLSIFSMFLLHQVSPHVHHDHENEDHSIEIQSEHTHDTPHHHHSDEQDNEDFDLLGLLFGNHAHGIQADNLVFAKSIAKQQSTERMVSFAAIIHINTSLDEEKLLEKQTFWHGPPYQTRAPYLSSLSLRGPPSLG